MLGPINIFVIFNFIYLFISLWLFFVSIWRTLSSNLKFFFFLCICSLTVDSCSDFWTTVLLGIVRDAWSIDMKFNGLIHIGHSHNLALFFFYFFFGIWSCHVSRFFLLYQICHFLPRTFSLTHDFFIPWTFLYEHKTFCKY